MYQGPKMFPTNDVEIKKNETVLMLDVFSASAVIFEIFKQK
jgi:hypothetical protein